MTIQEQLQRTYELIRLEREADLEQYRQKVMLLPLHRKTKEGKTWYPVQLKRDYIGTGERLVIEIERTKERDQPHVFSSGKVVSLFCNANQTPDKQNTGGVINYVRENLMVITLNGDDLPDWIHDGQLGVDVMFDENSYREMEAALKHVMKSNGDRLAQLRDILLGDRTPATNPTPLASNTTSLNTTQQEAVATITCAADVAIIHGPPGTGKTTTLVHSIVSCLQSEQQVLVCAPSNTAVDLLTDKLAEAGLRVLRLGHPARVTEQSLGKTLDARIAAHEYYKDLKSMRKKMEQLRASAFKYKRDFGHRERQQRKLLLDEAKAMKADADVLEFYIVNDLLQNSDVICCTLVGSSHYLLRGKRYSSVFIDEAAQALEPACWIPISKADRVIFAGDHCQLPPTIKSIDAAKSGLANTLFQKCRDHHPDTAVMLKTQYRMHEDIMKFSSQFFYKDELIAHETVRLNNLPGIDPVEFIDTAGCGYQELQDRETLSRLNKEEATVLIKVIENLIETVGLTNWKDQQLRMGIITPYSAQVDYLHKLADSSALLQEISSFISIDTVDAFQGQERDIIAISFVRSNDKSEVGFLSDIRRTNVAMTRAKRKLIMVGDSATLGSHPFYLELIDFVQSKNYYKSAFEVMY